ncbi:MAG: GHKL domain-containing protein, partial [Lachnospiraceae bacterium]|nr:GHKL domain-containing protein [Lachnospiraceae bacterium]
EYEGDEWIANIQKQTARLTRLVGELVALSRMDEEIPFPEKSTFSLSDAAWETAEPFAVRAKAEGKNYCQHIEENLTCYGDRNSIQQLISILLDNAVKYAAVAGEIRLDIYRRRRKVCIEVTNTCDLPDTVELDRLFDRFYRVDEARSAGTGGTGIGLAMAQAIVETHSGKIKAERTGEKTICFRVLL